MKMKRIAIAGIVALALTSLGGVAFAKVSAHQQSTPATSSETTTGVDTDNVQEGDQTSRATGSESSSRTGAVGERATEADSGSGESDGPGGHEDPAGNVDHQFDGQE